jgi:Tol biopolymer transport system component
VPGEWLKPGRYLSVSTHPMTSPFLRHGALAVLLLGAASCEISTRPDDGTSGGGFTLLIKRGNAAGGRSFYTLSADGKRVTPFDGVPSDAVRLMPSPDGATIAYLRATAAGVDLWAMDRDGANRRPILAGAYSITKATWSPDGTRLAVAYSTADVSQDIATINANGTGFVDLTPDPLPGVYHDQDPAWSPDGTRIAYSSNASGTRRLWIMNADGTNPHQVLPLSYPSSEREPAWAPDSTNLLAVVASTADGPGIAFVRDDGSDFRDFPFPGSPTAPAWLPDGRVAFVGNTSGNYDVWTADPATGATTQLTARRDNDVDVAVLADAAPFTWLGFADPVTYQVNRPFAVQMATADVITDSVPDVLILSPLLNEIRIMRGSSSGSLQSIGGLFVESDVSAMRTGLITSDLAPDVVGRGDSVAYLWRGRSDGPGIATPIPMNGALRDLAVVDLDGNGRGDIVSLVETAGQPFRVRTHTVGTDDAVVLAANIQTSRLNARSLCAGDFTGDGLPDLAIFAGSSTLSAFLAEGRGELAVNDLVPAGSTISSDLGAVPWCADFDNDGRDDVLLFSAGAAQSVDVHRFGTTTLGGGTQVAGSARAIAIADVDRDGDLDIVMASATSAEVLVAKNRGGGTFDSPTAYAVDATPVAITAADLNGDGWPDVAVVGATGTLSVLLSRGRAGM